MKYTEAMAQISTPEEEKRAIAKKMYQQYSEAQKPVMRRSRRKLGWTIAAAAAAVCLGTVSVGAAAGWNYAELFERYFSQTAEAPVSFDFTGMGSDIGEVFDTDDFTVTLEGCIADTYSLYFYYDVKLKNAETEPQGEALFDSLHADIMYCLPGSDQPFFTGSSGRFLGQDEDGTVHYVERFSVPNGESLEGLTLEAYCECVGSGNDAYSGDRDDRRAVTFDTVYPTELHQLETPIALNVPNTDEMTEQNYAAVSPIGIYLTADADETFEALSEYGGFGTIAGENAEVTVHYADGTEETMEAEKTVNMSFDEFGTLTENVTLLSFAKPVLLDSVEYFTFDGIDIPA